MEDLIPIVAIVMTFGLPMLVIWTRHQKSMAQLSIEATAEKAAQYAASNKELEDRVRVLERIVTDGSYDLASKIEALRDERPLASRMPERETEAKV